MNNLLRSGLTGLVVLAALSVLTPNTTNAASQRTTAPTRQYYLTQGAVNGDNALTACASGYHFASFGEISNLSSLSYNSTLGRMAADSGSGPPLAPGWIRTGGPANVTQNSNANCNVWTSASSTDFGTVAISGAFPDSPDTLLFGSASLTECDNSGGLSIGVWCIEN